MCPYPCQVQGEDQTLVLAHPLCGKAPQSYSGVHPFTGVLSFPILLGVCHRKWLLGASQASDIIAPGSRARRDGDLEGSACPLPMPPAFQTSPYFFGKGRGCPGHCPPPAGPAGWEPGAEAWHVSGCHHQFGSRHRKPLQRLSRGHWHLWVQNIPETKSTAFNRDAGASLIPGGAVEMALGIHSLPSLVHSIPSLDN